MSPKLSQATGRPLFTRNNENNEVLLTQNKAVWNTDQNAIACVASKDYRIIQHYEVITSLTDTLQTLGIAVKGRVRDYGNTVAVEVLLKDKFINDEQVGGVQVGFRLANSYNKTKGIKGELYACRLVCSNGMRLWTAIAGVQLDQMHMGEFNLSRMIEEFVKNAIQQYDRLQKLVSESIKDTYEWELCCKFIEQAVKRKKWREAILKELALAGAGKKCLSRWDVYNVITSLATHGEKLTVGAEEYLQGKAQQVLSAPLELEAVTE